MTDGVVAAAAGGADGVGVAGGVAVGACDAVGGADGVVVVIGVAAGGG